MTPLDELRKMRVEVAESLRRAEADALAGKKPMLSPFDRSERQALLQRLDAQIGRLDAG